MKFLIKTARTAYVGLQTSLIYRMNFLLGFLSGFMTLAIQLIFWPSFYSAGTDFSYAVIKNTVIAGYNLREILTYSLLVYFIQRGNTMMNIGESIKQDIKNGELNLYLTRPTNYIWSKWVFAVSGQLVNLLISFVVLLAVLACIRIGFVLPADPKQMVYIILFVILAYMLSFFIHCIIGLLSFWILETSSVSMILNATISILSGAIFPLNYLDNSISALIKYLPFSYLAWFPAQVYLNKVSEEELLQNLLLCCCWILLLGVVLSKLWKRGLRRYAAFGG